MTMGECEPKWAPSLGEGVVPVLERIHVGIAFGNFVSLCFKNSGNGSPGFPWFRICRSL